MTYGITPFMWNSKEMNFIYSDIKQISGCLGLWVRDCCVGRGIECDTSWLWWWLLCYIHLSELTELYTWNWWILLHVYHTSMKLVFKKFLLTPHPSSATVPFFAPHLAQLLKRTVCIHLIPLFLFSAEDSWGTWMVQ